MPGYLRDVAKPHAETTTGLRITEVESGARNVDHILTRTLLPEISREFLARMAEGQAITKVHVSVDGDGSRCREIGYNALHENDSL